jgi:hypothetical protein
MSNYWTPQLYVHKKDGTFSPVPVMGDGRDVNGGMAVYYLQRPSPATENITAFPAGFRMLAGDSNKRAPDSSLATTAISWNCLGAGKAETNGMPNYKCSSGLRAQVFFPACWNGKDLDSPDHKSHMSYPDSQNYDNGPCPATHPVKTISLFYEILYDTPQFDSEWNGTQHPFVLANGDTTGYGLHGDFLNGWDVDVLQKAINTCTDASGAVEKCAAVTQFTGSECQACTIPSTVQETIDGSLTKLPGCNDVTYGPDRAVASKCGDTATVGAGASNFVDLTSSPTMKWEYAGCGGDGAGDRAFRNASTAYDSMTVESCVSYCSAGGWAYAGMEYSRECFCADRLDPRYAPKDGIMGNCNYQCGGNSTEICGGWAAMSIYHTCEGQVTCRNWDIKYRTPTSSSLAVSSSTSLKASSTTVLSKVVSSTMSSIVKTTSTKITTSVVRVTSSAPAPALKVASSKAAVSSSPRAASTPSRSAKRLARHVKW